MRNVENIDSKTALFTEADCVQRLQDVVSEISRSIFLYISNEKSAEHFIKPGIFSYLHENNFFDNKNNIIEKKLEKHCRLAALFLILKKFSESKIVGEPANFSNIKLYLDNSYQQLPENFRNFLDYFSEITEENFTGKQIDSIDCIVDNPSDIIGIVYNKFSYNEHQQNHGQHFTPSGEADILNAFCINKKTQIILDSSCGSGTFLLRAFYFLQHFHPEIPKEILVSNLTGVDISPYAVYLTAINLFLKSKKNFNGEKNLFKENFLKKSFKENNQNKKRLPFFDACIGNPPFIRHEVMENKKEWLKLIKEEYGISYISGQSDLYIYFLIHTSFFLKEGARLGYVISASWLDVQFGGGLQRFLLDHFKIITIIDYQAKRSFNTASVNTVLLVIEKCKDASKRKNNLIKFVRIFSDYEEIIGEIESRSRITNAIKFAATIENSENYLDKNFQVETITQKQLEDNSTISGKYSNGHWGARYLRSPEIYHKIISNAGKKLIPLSDIAEVKYGIKTGANDFFYLIDETEKAQNLSKENYEKTFGQKKEKHQQTWKDCGWYLCALNDQHFIIEREFVKPVFKTQKEADKLDVKISNLRFIVIHCSISKEILAAKNKRILHYIHFAEKEFAIHKRPSVNGRNLWYDLTASLSKGQFIFPSKIGEKYRLIDNRTSQVVCDKVNYVIKIKPEFKQYTNELFLILNSICFRYFLDLFARQLTGSQTLSDVDVNLLKKTGIPHPGYFRDHCKCIDTLMKEIKSREQLPISIEILQEDKLKIDQAIFNAIGLKETDRNQLYKEASEYVEKRQLKSDSLKT